MKIISKNREEGNEDEGSEDENDQSLAISSRSNKSLILIKPSLSLLQ